MITGLEMIKSEFWNKWWDLKVIFWRIQCWFKGHIEKRFYAWPDEYYCDRCFINDPDEENTLPMVLNRLYIWAVERHWNWFDKLDEWLCENYSKRLPNWWSY